ncbi:MAG: hypothetical protein RIT17_1205 [Pseudomonadota bacterium]|jgi:hypothetical protein
MSLPPIPRPERAEGTVLAALLAVLLGLMLVTQVLLPAERPDAPDVPPAGLRSAPVTIAAVNADPALARRSIFQPVRIAGADNAGVPAGPLDGATPAGIIRVRGAARLVLQTPGGGSVTLRPGQSWRGWQLAAIGRDTVRFARGAETITLGLGADTQTSYPGSAPRGYDPRAYRPNQADEQ